MQKYDFSHLSLEERMRMSEALWESIYADAPPVPQWHKEILDERIAEDDAALASGVREPREDWREVFRRLTAR